MKTSILICFMMITIVYCDIKSEDAIKTESKNEKIHTPLTNIIRTVRSKVGKPSVEIWGTSVSDFQPFQMPYKIRKRRSLTMTGQSMADGPVNDLQPEPRLFPDMDQIHVVSSAIRVLPSSPEDQNPEEQQSRQKRNEYQWRKPKAQFVTRTERMSSLAPRYHQVYQPDRSDRYLLDNEISPYRRSGYPQRRIIYYATLPEIVRRPNQDLNWQYTSRQSQPAFENRPYYPLIRDNEVTRVQSSLIDVTNRDSPSSPSQTPAVISSAPPKYTIIDAEPPYLRPYYTNYPYNVRYPQPYYVNRYFDDVRTPPYRIHQTFQPPYYSKPEYVPVESPTPLPTVQSVSTTTQQQQSTDKTDNTSTNSTTNDDNDKFNKNSFISRYV